MVFYVVRDNDIVFGERDVIVFLMCILNRPRNLLLR